jgi:AcrR family transcriptional regulator
VGGDWLVGGDRRAAAAERIYSVATELVTRDGIDALDIDVLAKRAHCSRATIYRHVGGKAEIRDAVLTRAAADIVGTVRRAVENLSGPERIITAITVALRTIRSDPLGQVMINSLRGAQGTSWLTRSPTVAELAVDINGLTDDDPQAAQWIVRILFSLLYWPVDDAAAERDMVARFIGPAFGG